ncbi:glycosyl hydrolase family 18 protein [Aquibacillus salsiterrae]|uniref:chitinase n=1 Tax=Aquibacillus salsiterrae TaxID=2950439 RepID=A0A9X3WAU2_9BACI|nr:glycosyl hydrolase family 18 protein [Aquibacillus salsiterrae]MDC3415937.1 glycosyl hydrolase family 18 protein [Aquibacillus salsiterrae]
MQVMIDTIIYRLHCSCVSTRLVVERIFSEGIKIKANYFWAILFPLILLTSFTTWQLTTTQAESKFSDVSIYSEQINYLSDQGIITGYEDGTFKPNKSITRLQAVQMILNEMGVKQFDAKDPGFSDIGPFDYGYPYVAKAVELGIITGKNGGTTFDTQGLLTRGQMAAIMTNAYQLVGNGKVMFLDTPKSHWAFKPINALATNEITVGYPDYTFQSHEQISRAHFALFLVNYMNKRDDNTLYTIDNPPTDIAPENYKRVGYYAGWATYSGYQVSDIDASKLTHLNYAFATISDDGKMIVGDEADTEKAFPGDTATQDFKGNFNQLTKLKEQNPDLKTLISVGGWTWSDKFSDVAQSDESRTIFANSVVDFLTTYQFDGVDIDWEYPVGGGKPGNKSRPEDKQNFTLLLEDIRKALDAQTKKDGNDYLLTIAAGSSNKHASNLELEKIAEYVDYIQLMTYDIHGEWDQMSGFNAPLFRDPDSKFYWDWSVDDSVKTYIASGITPGKLVMGLAFYGREFYNVTNSNNGLYQPFSGGRSVSYKKITNDYLNRRGFTRYWDEDTKVPYLFNGSTFVSYSDEKSIGYKTAYIQMMGLGGAMIWELSQDKDDVLLSKVYDELK